MILSDITIREMCTSEEDKDKLISPFHYEQLQPSSYDLRLDNKFIYPFESDEVQEIPDGKRLIIKPNDFVLLTTQEIVNIPQNMVGVVDGKSSVGRVGGLVHVTAGYLDPNFTGKVTLEFKNLGNYPIALKKGSKIAQVRFHKLNKKCGNPYNVLDNHYQGQSTVVPSRYEKIDNIYMID